MSPADKSLKAQMRQANKTTARRVLILGESELAADAAQLKDMAGGGQSPLALGGLGPVFAQGREASQSGELLRRHLDQLVAAVQDILDTPQERP
jgi:histidyl-tRNA synthetase